MANMMSEVDDREFDEKSEVTDFEVVAEGRSFWVARAILASYSPVFRVLCYDTAFKEAREGKVILEGKKKEDVLLFLRHVAPPGLAETKVESVAVLLRFSEEYDVHYLKVKCHNFLRSKINWIEEPSNPDPILMRLLVICSEFRFLDAMTLELVERCVYVPYAEIQPHLSQLPSGVAGALLDKITNTMIGGMLGIGM
jgi:hypothetical protein